MRGKELLRNKTESREQLAKNSPHFPKEIQKVTWLPTKQTWVFERTEKGLVVLLPGKTSDELWPANVIKVLS